MLNDTEYFESYMRYAGLAQSVVAQILRDRSRTDIEDVMQETYVKGAKAFRTTEIECFRNWIVMIARNTALLVLRSRKRESLYADPFESGGSAEESTVAARPKDPLSDLTTHEMRERIERVLEGVSHDAAEAFRLFYFAGFTFREAGEVLGVHENTIKQRVFRARKFLRSSLAQPR